MPNFRWSEWSTERMIKFGDLDGIKESGRRYRIHQIDNEIETSTAKGKEISRRDTNVRLFYC